MSINAGAVALEQGREAHVCDDLRGAEAKAAAAHWRVRVTDCISDIETDWRNLEAHGLESPAQSFDFNRVWVETLEIPCERRAFVCATVDDEPVMVLALGRRRMWGMNVLCPLSGSHVGTNSPLVDRKRIGQLSCEQRGAIRNEMLELLGADLVTLPHILEADVHVFGSVDHVVTAETLYRTEFDSWERCDREQRTRNRRKHDKQQASKLAALGEVTFEEVRSPHEVSEILDKLFKDRAARFDGLGIADPFAPACVRAFYRTMFDASDTLPGILHVLRLDGNIVATRYSLAAGDKMFCLISSMDSAPELLAGSPGKQILVHVMRHVFDNGTRIFDLGSGFSDEKRHWCNVQVPLANVYLAASAKGSIGAQVLLALARLKAKVKSNEKLFAALKVWRARLARFTQRHEHH